MKYAFFSDMDGTLYPHARKPIVNSGTINDIKLAQSYGVEIIFCTGNGLFSKVLKYAKDLNIKYVISSNGSLIKNIENDEIVYENKINFEKIKKIFDFASKYNIDVGMWNIDSFYSNESNNTLYNIMQFYMGEVPKVSLEKFSEGALTIIVNNIQHEDIFLKYVVSLNLQYIQHDNHYIEISNIGVSKGTAIQTFCGMFNIDLDNVACAGDSENDIPMLELLKYSYAMDNASPLCKKAAKMYTADVLQNGMGRALLDYMHRLKIDRIKDK